MIESYLLSLYLIPSVSKGVEVYGATLATGTSEGDGPLGTSEAGGQHGRGRDGQNRGMFGSFSAEVPTLCSTTYCWRLLAWRNGLLMSSNTL